MLSFKGVFRLLIALALSFVGVVLALVVVNAVQQRHPDIASELRGGWEATETVPIQIDALRGSALQLDAALATEERQLRREVSAAEALTERAVMQRLAVLERESSLIERQKLTPQALAKAALTGQRQALLDHYLSSPRLAAISVERDALFEVQQVRAGQRRETGDLEDRVNRTKRDFDKAEAELRRLDRGPWRMQEDQVCAVIPRNAPWVCQASRRIAQLRLDKAKALEANQKALRQLQGARTAAKAGARVKSDLAAFHSAARQSQAQLQTEIHGLEAQMRQNPVGRVRALVEPVVGQAVAIMLGVVFVPIGVRLTHYYLVAPLAARCRPIIVLSNAAGAGSTGATLSLRDAGERRSAPSLRLRIEPDQELLIRPDWLQSVPVAANSRTQWLLDRRMWLSSLAAGMSGLTRVRCESATEAVTIASPVDALAEVALVTLPPAAAFVLQPRALVGVLGERGRPPRITRHLRLGKLSAWLTFQLRYIVFHGPCTLVVHGRRGVRLEPAGAGRLLGRDQTLGFSANLAYASRRTETFMPYALGLKPLLKDSFAGDGFLLFEELPGERGRKSLVSRNVEGLWDAGLKLFGV